MGSGKDQTYLCIIVEPLSPQTKCTYFDFGYKVTDDCSQSNYSSLVPGRENVYDPNGFRGNKRRKLSSGSKPLVRSECSQLFKVVSEMSDGTRP